MVEPNSSLAQSLRYSRLVKTRLPPVVAGGWWCSQAVEVESKKRVAVDINTRTSSQPSPAQPSPASPAPGCISPSLPHSACRPAHCAPSTQPPGPATTRDSWAASEDQSSTCHNTVYPIFYILYNSNIHQIVPACVCVWCPVPTMCSSGGLHAAVLTSWPVPATSHQPPSC